MLTRQENDLLRQVGPGTPMGELMRRYWHPIAAVAEMDDTPVKPVRLMGEDFVLYRDKAGTYGLLERHCPHRRADLSYGWVEQHGLRCSYHGWLFDEAGRCLAQPFEEKAHPDARFKDKISVEARHVRAKAGLLWAYIGEAPVPELWDWDRYYDRGYKQVVFSTVPCNWLQCQENSIDPVHFEWLHSNWSLRLKDEDGESPTHLRVGFDEFEFGFRYRRVRADTDEENELWTVGRVCLWPNALFTGHFEWRVPIDDETTLSVGWFIDPIPGERPFEQEIVPYWRAPIRDEETGRWITSHVMNQDFVAWGWPGSRVRPLERAPWRERSGRHHGQEALHGRLEDHRRRRRPQGGAARRRPEPHAAPAARRSRGRSAGPGRPGPASVPLPHRPTPGDCRRHADGLDRPRGRPVSIDSTRGGDG